jgi:hypothetical protein
MTRYLAAFADTDIWSVVTRITNPFNLSAFALAIVLYLVVRKRRGDIPFIVWAIILLLVVIPVGASLYRELIHTQTAENAIYHVRITVVDPQSVPVEDAKVWSSAGGEPKRVAGGWQFDIPAASKSQDGKVTVYATQENAFLRGQTEMTLLGDHNPAATIQLKHDDTARVRGQVVDSQGNAVAGARVTVVGFGSEGTVTQTDGGFELPAHAAISQQILLHAEKTGFKSTEQYHPAGRDAVTLVLLR